MQAAMQMSRHGTSNHLFHSVCVLLLCFSWLCSLSHGKRTPPPLSPSSKSSSRLPVRAVCLGGRRLAGDGGLDPAVPLRRHPQQGSLGWHAAAVQVGGVGRVLRRRAGRWRGGGREPDAGLRMGDLQAMEDQRDDVQPEGVRRAVRGCGERRRGCGAPPAVQTITTSEERWLGDSGLRREHELGRRRPVSVRGDQSRGAARGVPDLQRLRHIQVYAHSQEPLEHIHSGGGLQVHLRERADGSENPSGMVDRQRPQPSGSLRRRFAQNLGQRVQMGRGVQSRRDHRPSRSSRVTEPMGAQLLPGRHAGLGNHRRQHRADGAGHRVLRVQVRQEPEPPGGGADERAAGARRVAAEPDEVLPRRLPRRQEALVDGLRGRGSGRTPPSLSSSLVGSPEASSTCTTTRCSTACSITSPWSRISISSGQTSPASSPKLPRKMALSPLWENGWPSG